MSALNLRLEVEEEELNQEFGGYKPRESASILTRCLNLDADLSVREAFLRLYAMLPERETQISYGDIRISWPELNLGGLLLDAARQIPYSHPAQAKLVKLVQNLGRCDRFTKPIGMPGYVFYDGMTEFKRECHRIGGATWDTDTEAQQLVNICAFQGRLASTGFLNPRELMIWWMRDTLERPASSYAWSTLVMGSAVWIRYGGSFLFQTMVLDLEPEAEYYQVFETYELYDGPVFGLERWDFWQRRFAEISTSEAYPVNDEARRLAADAADYMAALARTARPSAINTGGV